MRVNVEKVLERDQKLSELDDRAGKPCATLSMMVIFTSNHCRLFVYLKYNKCWWLQELCYLFLCLNLCAIVYV